MRTHTPFKTKAIKLDTRGDAINWIIANQLGRRNLSEEQKGFLRGKRYQAEKKAASRPEKGGQNDQKLTTAEKLAKEYGVSEVTIRRDAKFAEAVDKIAENCGDEVKN